ncbi:MAG TPA: hypothetical protein VML55_00970 [Planctomycetaceae bacterium]|nr:hypothetical protein [Planctomycetaceae bacterium]
MYVDVRHNEARCHRERTGSAPARGTLGRVLLVLPALAAVLAGCSAHRPIKGIPVSELPEEWRHPITYRSARQTIDLSLLRQTPPAEHRVDAGDVLGIYIEGVLGGHGQLPPVYTPQDTNLPPSMGYPVAVRGDGSLSLPGYPAFDVRGLTLRQVEERIRAVCSGGEQPLLVQGNEQIIVSLQRPRVARVMVIRQEAGNEAGHGPQQGDYSNRQKRGTGRVVSLPAYRNDVLHALAETGGLPGLDAENVIYVIRGSQDRPPAVAPAPAPAERSVRREASGRGMELQSVQAFQGRSGTPSYGSTERSGTPSYGLMGRGRIQRVGGLVEDPFLAEPNPFEPTESASQPEPVERWPFEPAEATSAAGAIEPWPSAPRPDPPARLPAEGHGGLATAAGPVMDEAPLRGPSRPQALLFPLGHSTVDERFQGLADEAHAQGALPPLPPEPVELPASDRLRTSDRSSVPVPQPDAEVWRQLGWAGRLAGDDPTVSGSRVVRIPLKLLPGEMPQFGEQDIVLNDGDVVFVETREQDFFMTGGLLGGAHYPLPRDYDVTVIDAIAIAEQSGSNPHHPTKALGGVSALNQDVTVGASKVIVLRTLPDGCEVPIEVDLYKAIRDPGQRVVIQAGDRIILRYTRLEAIGAFFERHILDGAVIGLSSAAVFNN